MIVATKYKLCFFSAMMIFFLALAGCGDSNSPEQLAYAHGLGLDYEDGKVKVHLQLLNLGALAKTEGGGGDVSSQSTSELATASGKILDEAIFNLYRSAQHEIFWGNLSHIVLTERFLSEYGLGPVIDMWSRFPEARYQIKFYSTNDKVEEILLTDPVMDVSKSLSLLATPESASKQNTLVSFVNLRKILMELKEPNYLARIPSIFVVGETWKTPEKKRPFVALNGLTLYDRKKRFLGTVEGKHIEGYRWTIEKFDRAPVILDTDGEAIGSIVVQKKKVKITPKPKSDHVKFHMKIKAEGHIAEIDKKVAIQTIERRAAKKIKQQVLQTYREALKVHPDADVYRLSETLYRNDVKAWKKLSKKGKLDLQQDSLQVDVEVTIMDSWRDHMSRFLE